MSKLSDFYNHKESIYSANDNLRHEGVEWDRLEDKLINEEVLPELLDAISSILQKVKSSLDIHVVYNPDGIISITSSRCVIKGISERVQTTRRTGIESHFKINLEQSEFSSGNSTTRSKSVGFSVIFPDGTVYHDRKAVKTFIQSLKKIGLSRVASGKHGVVHNGVNVVSRMELGSNDQLKIQTEIDGFFVYTKLSNKDKFEDLKMLSRYYNLGLTITWDKEPKSVIKPLKKKGSRDTTKYSFNGGPGLAKRRLALAIVKQYVADNPFTTLKELETVFPASLISGRYGVIRSIEDMPDITEEEKHKRYLMEDEEVIPLHNDDIVVVCSQWGDNIQGMIEIAEGLGYRIQALN